MNKQWLTVTASILSFLLAGSIFIQNPSAAAEKGTEINERKEQPHHFVKEGDFERLLKQGYTKKEIYKAAHIAKYAEKKVDDVLKIYKDYGSSWEKTTQHFGVDLQKIKKHHHHMEKYLQQHKGTVIENVAEYTGKTKKEIDSWLNEGISLRFIVGGAAMAKASNKDLKEVIKLKQAGKSFKQIKQELKIDDAKMRDEMKKLIRKIKEDIKG
ncbi:hypothetical protein BGM26_13865 [Bacillus sp. FJAT-29790]|uniref:hypothetical protein n=1 Tax=Bacillus sp. FJAT-29790 TaxID=1895002 RepID=UPI001C2311B5|nr:hypothetical protein [Bacillus sp. FJAT-29790]MBU8880064.1 hypothetical protein [Bacillus sp. FJAT-29790]